MSQPLPTYDVCIVLDGASVQDLHECAAQAQHIIAADGAAAELLRRDITLHAVVGDFDSLTQDDLQRLASNGVALHASDDQDTTDFEKCLMYCLNNGHHTVLIVGFDGGDIDHLLGNWSALQMFCRDLDLTVATSTQHMTVGSGLLRLTLHTDSIVSIVPHNHARVTSQGLKWELNNLELKLGKRVGTRNKSVNSEVSIVIHSGVVTVIYPREGRHSWHNH